MLSLSVIGSIVGAYGQPNILEVVLQINSKDPLGDELRKALTLRVTQVNAQGGVPGRRLGLTVFDQASDAVAAEYLLSRILSARPVASIGPTNTEAAITISPLLVKQGILTLIPFGDPRLLGNIKTFRSLTDSQLVFFTGPPLSLEGQAVVALLRKVLRGSSIVIVTDHSQLGDYYAEAAKSLLKLYGVSPVPAIVDPAEAVGKLGAYVVYAPTGRALQLFFKNLPPQGGRGTLVVGGIASSSVPATLPAGITFYGIVPVTEKFVSFADSYAKSYASTLRDFRVASWVDALDALVAAINRTGSVDSRALGKALRTSSYDGLTGSLWFDRKGERVSGAWSFVRLGESQTITRPQFLAASGPTDPRPPIPPP